MTSRFAVSQSTLGARATREMLQRQIETAVAKLPSRLPTDEQVHSVRKHMKAARATLRLLRPLLSDHDFRLENRALRDAARAFSAARDGAVLVQTLGELIPKAKDNNTRRGLAAFEARLKQDAEHKRRRLAQRGLQQSAAKLRAALARVHSWPAPRANWAAICRSLRKTYRQGRRCARRNAWKPSAATLHEWRKRTKYLRSQLEVIAPVQHASLHSMTGDLHRLSDQLGKEHDLAVLRDLSHQRDIDRKAERSLESLIRKRRRKLRKRALLLGVPLYAERPARFEARLRRYFRQWT